MDKPKPMSEDRWQQIEADCYAHTEGPWKFDDRHTFGQRFVRQDPDNWNGMGYQYICSLPTDKKATHYGDMFHANGKLIEAAPDLLTEVRRLRAELAEYRALARAAAAFEPGYDETADGFVRRLGGIYNRKKGAADG